MLCVDGVKYVYRHPGGTSGNLIDREAKVYAQKKAIELGVDKSVIHINKRGWKISYFVTNMAECNFEKYPAQLEKTMEYLRQMHNVEVDVPIKCFYTIEKGKN